MLAQTRCLSTESHVCMQHLRVQHAEMTTRFRWTQKQNMFTDTRFTKTFGKQENVTQWQLGYRKWLYARAWLDGFGARHVSRITELICSLKFQAPWLYVVATWSWKKPNLPWHYGPSYRYIAARDVKHILRTHTILKPPALTVAKWRQAEPQHLLHY